MLLRGAVFCLALSSCDNFMDVHKQYIEGGEIIYAPKVSEVIFQAGNERVYFQCALNNSPNVTSIDIYWNGRLDSLIVPVTPSTGLFEIDMFIPGLEEKSYSFEVRTTDTYGHKSLWTAGTGNAYGEIFQSTLSNRRIGNFIFAGESGSISWLTAVETLLYSEVRYKDTEGTVQVVKVMPDELTTVLENADPEGTFEYRSLFVPEPDAVDTFAVEWIRIYPIAMFDKTGWTITCSSEAPGYSASFAIDGIANTAWHCAYAAPAPPFPHWLEIDMQSERSITSIEVNKRNALKTISFELSVDGVDWTDVGSVEFPNTNNNTPTANIIVRTLNIEETRARYLRLNFIDGFSGANVGIWEVSVLGKMD